MDWSDLGLFLVVARQASLRKAASELRIDVSTVSRRLASLEASLGVRLLDRLPGGVVPTAAGEEMLRSATRVQQEVEQLGRRIAGRDKRLSGTVKLTLGEAFSELVPRLLVEFRERHPAIELELLVFDGSVDLGKREADVALRVADAPPDQLVGRRVARLGAALYASRQYAVAHPRSLDDPQQRWVDWDRRFQTKPALAWIHERHPVRVVAVRGTTTRDVFLAVRAGLGVGGLPCVLGDAEPSLVRLENAPEATWSSVWVLTHREVRPTARVKALADFLAEAMRRERAVIEGR